MRAGFRQLVPFIIIFILFNNFFLFGKNLLIKWQLDNLVLIIANSAFFLMYVLAYAIQKKALKNANPNVFVRSVMSGMMIRMILFIAAILIYMFNFKNSFNKFTIVAVMVVYLIYLTAEVRIATKLNKERNA